jgi:ribosome biogenesis GTPase A
MVRAMRRIGEGLALVDVVIEAVDARVARSGSNPSLARMIRNKPHLTVLTRSDLADPAVTRAWLERFEQQGRAAVAIDARRSRGVARVVTMLPRGRAARTLRTMIVGIPNSGKSSIVNALLKRASARVQNRAGITRQMQWFRLAPGVELMDTPGILPPRIATAAAQWKLAACAAVPSERYDPAEVAHRLARWARRHGLASIPSFEDFAARGFLGRGGKVDEHNAAQSYLRAFGDGKFGRVSLESPDDEEAA